MYRGSKYFWKNTLAMPILDSNRLCPVISDKQKTCLLRLWKYSNLFVSLKNLTDRMLLSFFHLTIFKVLKIFYLKKEYIALIYRLFSNTKSCQLWWFVQTLSILGFVALLLLRNSKRRSSDKNSRVVAKRSGSILMYAVIFT